MHEYSLRMSDKALVQRDSFGNERVAHLNDEAWTRLTAMIALIAMNYTAEDSAVAIDWLCDLVFATYED